MQRRRSIAGPDEAQYLDPTCDRREGDLMIKDSHRSFIHPTEPPRPPAARWNPSGAGQ